jgi:hypothetical protein
MHDSMTYFQGRADNKSMRVSGIIELGVDGVSFPSVVV